MSSSSAVIDSFRGDFRFLSNFYPAVVNHDGMVFQSVENAYQAAKTYDMEIRAEFVDIDANTAKKLGREIEVSDDWEERKLEVMSQLLRQKFSSPDLAELLLMTTGYELIEGNWWGDTFWGVCKGKGQNHLGKLLMDTRDWLDSDRIF